MNTALALLGVVVVVRLAWWLLTRAERAEAADDELAERRQSRDRR